MSSPACHRLSTCFELSRPGAAPQLRAMEGLRGLAVLLVFLVHYVSLEAPWRGDGSAVTPLATALHSMGNAGVDLFFVLSGYLIYGSLMCRQQALLPYLRRRARRIYPVYSCVFVLYLLLSWALPSESRIPAAWPQAVAYLTSNFLLLSGFTAAPPFISVAWSLSYEMLYYLLIPLLILVFDLRRRSRSWRGGFFAMLTLLAGGLFAIFGGPARLLLFIAGILVHEALAAPAWRAPPPALAACAVPCALGCLLLPLALLLKLALLACAFFLLCLCCFQARANWLARLFCWTPLRWLGNISYSYYLIHGLALKGAFLALALLHPPQAHGLAFFLLLMPLMLALSLPPAMTLFLLVERPLSLSPLQASVPAMATAPAAVSSPALPAAGNSPPG
ncbi:acyltransferase family protein [Janthinobacterium sp. RA13]|uniref:acyltransferase family protein n=1 Tax=Janthinobacterium sp. RA13 TaxID=1502762 RepID=UPI00068A9BE0|nr:acyltransferase [Janthinobacterium sp. RA13]